VSVRGVERKKYRGMEKECLREREREREMNIELRPGYV
jgi:hypothetical protein